MTVIKDGTGTSLLARVDIQNRLHTVSISQTEIAHTSVHGEASFSVIGTTTIVASTEKTILILINNPTSINTIAIGGLRIALQGESGKVTTFKAYLGRSTFTSGGTIRTPTNLNANSPVSLDVSTYSDNPTLGGSDIQFQQAFEENTVTLDTDFDGSIVMPPSSSIRITVTGDTGAAGTKVAFVRFLYYAIDMSLHE
jgi:hypothetical protein